MTDVHGRYELHLFDAPEDSINAGTFNSINDCYDVVNAEDYPCISYPNWSIFDREQQETIETHYDAYSEV